LPTLQIFAKAPIAGTVKTRLMPAVGAARAMEIHERLVERTLATALAAQTAGIVGRIELWCAPSSDHLAFRAWQDRYHVTLATQQGTDLGCRMQHALGTSLARGVPAILIGTDCPPLDVSYLANAVSALDNDDVVFGPAEDGGYVLVGVARAVDAFSDILWGTESVMAQTRARLRAIPVSWHELPTLWDVDTPNDLVRWNDLVARGEAAETTCAEARRASPRSVAG
jgi:rSAM/selenodomain-associated transferase 1